MAQVLDIVQAPEDIAKAAPFMAEPLANEVAMTLATAYALAQDKEGRRDVCHRILSFCGELMFISNEFAGAVIGIVLRDQDQFMLGTMVRTAKEFNADPTIGPFLKMLKRKLLGVPDDQREDFLRRCEVKAGVWAGDTVEEINKTLRRYHLI